MQSVVSLDLKKVDESRGSRDPEDVETLTDRVYEERLRLVKRQLEIALQQRDSYARLYFNVSKIPFHQQREMREDDERELNSEADNEQSKSQTVV